MPHNQGPLNKVQDALRKELATEALDIEIEVSASDDALVMSGIVDVLQDKLAAEQVAKRVAGKHRVENRLTVATDGTVTDKEIRDAVERKLASSELYVPKVEVHAGKVRLQGSVDTLRQAQRIIERTSEVLAVKEIDAAELRVATTGPDDDATLQNRIEVALAGVVSAPDVDTMVQDGSVELRGFVNSRDIYRAIDELVSSVAGVRKVENRVQVRDQAH